MREKNLKGFIALGLTALFCVLFIGMIPSNRVVAPNNVGIFKIEAGNDDWAGHTLSGIVVTVNFDIAAPYSCTGISISNGNYFNYLGQLVLSTQDDNLYWSVLEGTGESNIQSASATTYYEPDGTTHPAYYIDLYAHLWHHENWFSSHDGGYCRYRVWLYWDSIAGAIVSFTTITKNGCFNPTGYCYKVG